MKTKKQTRDLSRGTFNVTSNDTGYEWDLGEVNTGSFQRIADACELIARNHAQLIADRDMYEKWYVEWRDRAEHYGRSVSALRGVITRMKSGERTL